MRYSLHKNESGTTRQRWTLDDDDLLLSPSNELNTCMIHCLIIITYSSLQNLNRMELIRIKFENNFSSFKVLHTSVVKKKAWRLLATLKLLQINNWISFSSK